jgi:hypothetical protein
VTRRAGAVANGVTFYVRYTVQFPITVIVEDLADQAVNGINEKVITRTDISDGAVGQAVADELLAVALASPDTVRYSTLATGVLKPGHTQTISLANRNLNGTFIVSEVTMRDRGARELVRTVRAIEGVVYDGSWRDVYERWLDGGSGAGSSVSAVSSAAIGPGLPLLSVQFNRTGTFGGNAAFTMTPEETSVRIGPGHTVNSGSYNLLIGEDHVVGST